MRIPTSLKLSGAVGRSNCTFAADSSRKILRNMDIKRNWGLRKEGAINIPVCNPHYLAGFVIEGSENMGDIYHLATLVNQLRSQGGSWGRIQALILDFDDRVG
jgi:hypothetical protein